MSTVNVIDLDKLITNGFEGKVCVARYEKVALIKSKTGVLIIDPDGCHNKYILQLSPEDNITTIEEAVEDQMFRVPVFKTEGEPLPSIGTYKVSIPVNLLLTQPYEEIPLREFIEDTNKSEIEENVNSLLESINEIGLNANNY